MTDYLGSQAWHDELIDLLRTHATPPSAAIIRGKDQVTHPLMTKTTRAV
jgi:hypothetical protein